MKRINEGRDERRVEGDAEEETLLNNDDQL